MNAWRRKIGTEGNDNKIALSQDKSNRGEQKREVALPPRVGKDSVYCARSARCTTRRIRSVTSAHAGETVSRPCLMLLPLPPHQRGPSEAARCASKGAYSGRPSPSISTHPSGKPRPDH